VAGVIPGKNWGVGLITAIGVAIWAWEWARRGAGRGVGDKVGVVEISGVWVEAVRVAVGRVGIGVGVLVAAERGKPVKRR